MSISESEASIICRQKGVYCEKQASGTRCYNFAISKNGIKGSFEVGDDGAVKVSYAQAYGAMDSEPEKTEVFDDATAWSAFWYELTSIAAPAPEVEAHGTANGADSEPEYDIVVESEYDPRADDDVATEELRLERVRRGQDIYRKRLERLWNGACAVTGITCQKLLIASHAKPWAECESGSERLSPYNGFLLNVALDALFDKFLISFDEDGKILIASSLNSSDLEKLAITSDMRLSKLMDGHKPFLEWHRSRFYELNQSDE